MAFTGFTIYAVPSKLCTALNARYEVFTQVLSKIQVFWDVTASRLVNSYSCFDGSLCFHLQCQAIQEERCDCRQPLCIHWLHSTQHKLSKVWVNNLFAAVATLSPPISFRQTTTRTYLCTYSSEHVAAAVASNGAYISTSYDVLSFYKSQNEYGFPVMQKYKVVQIWPGLTCM